jgi:hypothetical protein
MKLGEAREDGVGLPGGSGGGVAEFAAEDEVGFAVDEELATVRGFGDGRRLEGVSEGGAEEEDERDGSETLRRHAEKYRDREEVETECGSAGQRVSGSAGQRVSGSAGQRVSGSAGQRVSGSAGQQKAKLLLVKAKKICAD